MILSLKGFKKGFLLLVQKLVCGVGTNLFPMTGPPPNEALARQQVEEGFAAFCLFHHWPALRTHE